MSQVNKNIFLVSIYSNFFLIINLLFSYYALSVLGPENIGVYQSFLLIKDIVLFVNLGEIEGLRLVIPTITNEKKSNLLEDFINDSFSLSLYTLIFTTLILLFLRFIIVLDNKELVTYYSIVLLLIMTYLQYFFMNVAKGLSRFDFLASAYGVMTFATFLSFFLLFFADYSGFLLGKILIPTFSLIYLFFRLKIKIKLNYRINNFRLIVLSGIPLVLYSLFYAGFYNVGKIGILLFINDKTIMGLFAMGILAVSPLNNFMQALASVYFTDSVSAFKSYKTFESLIRKPLNQLNINFKYSMPIITYLSIAIFILIPIILPSYVDGIIPAIIILFGYPFLLSALPLNNSFLINKQYKLSILMFIIPAVLSVFITYIFVTLKLSLLGVSLAVVISYLLFFTCVIFFINRSLNKFKLTDLIVDYGAIIKYVFVSLIIILLESFAYYGNVSYKFLILFAIFLFISASNIKQLSLLFHRSYSFFGKNYGK